ncbi:hypothetical protein [Streptomyces sp. NPDC093097]|uniref:hypothetical protein n=1 Tax=Streptomyces sp. NPDC093097 TaxID=3366027 RepID=UPI003810DEFE
MAITSAMPATTAMPTAKKRPRRTHTKRVSHLPAIKLSQIPPSDIDLRDPLKAVLHCRNCNTWCPITGMQGREQKLVPHHTGKAGEEPPIRCRNSNRLVEFDLTLPEWHQTLADAHKDTLSRRPTNVLRKPKVQPAPAVSQIASQQQADDDGDGRTLWLVREMGWASTQRAVRDTDARRMQRPDGQAPAEGPVLPLEPADLDGYAKRQAELGETYRPRCSAGTA